MKRRRVLYILTIYFIVFSIAAWQLYVHFNKKHKKGPKPQMTEIQNSRYHFKFEIPDTWEAINFSDNGDGYLIIPDSGFEIRVYGEMILSKKNKALANSGNAEDFLFNDGFEGKLYEIDSTAILASRKDSLIRVNVYMKFPSDSRKHRKEYLKMAKSLKIN